MTDGTHGKDGTIKADAGEKDFLRRWSRLKREARTRDAGEGAAQPQNSDARSENALDVDFPSSGAASAKAVERDGEAPAVPPVESLNLDSDYRPFFHPKIGEGLRRAALKKLFSDPHFNVMDGLDVYIDDYSKSDPLPDGMLEQLEQAKKIIGWAREDAEERAKAEARKAAAGAPAPAGGDLPPAQHGEQPAGAQGSVGEAAVSATADISSPPRAE